MSELLPAYDPKRYQFPRAGWWRDHFWMTFANVAAFFGWHYHLATHKGEVDGWRRGEPEKYSKFHKGESGR
jgi:hypothetical protein